MADDATSTTPSGLPPQSDLDKVARTLMGDDTVEKYGDVMGVRKPTWKDGLRDFALGAAAGSPAKAIEMQSQLRKQFQDQLIKARRAALVEEQQKIQTSTKLVSGIAQIAKDPAIPAKYKTGLMKDFLAGQGISAQSPSVLKMFADADAIKDVDFDELLQKASEGQIDPQEIGGIFGSPEQAIGFLKQAQQYKQSKLTASAAAARLNKTEAEASIAQAEAADVAKLGPGEMRRRRWVETRLGKFQVPDGSGGTRLATAGELDQLSKALPWHGGGADPTPGLPGVPVRDRAGGGGRPKAADPFVPAAAPAGGPGSQDPSLAGKAAGAALGGALGGPPPLLRRPTDSVQAGTSPGGNTYRVIE
jgi:hypothetical protein